MFKRVDFPAPEGPIIAVSSPDRSLPLTDFKIVFTLFLLPSRTLYVKSVNASSTGGLFGRCVIVLGCAGTSCKRIPEPFLGCNKISLVLSSCEQFPQASFL